MRKLSKIQKSQLRKLRHLQPAPEWKESTRNYLLNELQIKEGSAASKKVVFSGALSSLFSFSGARWAQPIGVMVLVAGVVVGPGFATVSAARASLPGDALYTVKRGIERVDLSLTFSDSRKAEKKIDHVARRLDELHRITHEQVPGPEREQRIVLALEELKKDTQGVKSQLEQAKKGSDEDAVKIAKIIEEKTSTYKETIKSSANNLNEQISEGSQDDLQQALSSVQGVAIDALDILVDSEKKEEEADAKNEIKEKVVAQLQTTKDLITSTQKRLSDLQGVQEAAVEVAPEEIIEGEAVEGGEIEEEEQDTIEPEQEVVSEDTEAAEESVAQDSPLDNVRQELDEKLLERLTYAEQLVALGDFAGALEVLAEVKARVDEISVELRGIQVVKPDIKLESAEASSLEEKEIEPDEQPDEEDATEEAVDEVTLVPEEEAGQKIE